MKTSRNHATSCHLAASRNLTIKAIKFLTQAIHDEFGLTVQMGAELEYSAFDPEDPRFPNPMELRYNAKDSVGNAKYFEESKIISTHYKERAPNQGEVVFRHKHRGPLVLARAIESVKGKKILLSGTKKSLRRSGGKVFVHERNDEKLSVDFEPWHGDGDTLGLHLNTSLHKDGQNIFHKKDDPNDTNANAEIRAEAFAATMLPVLKELVLLHETGEGSFDRWKSRTTTSNFENIFKVKYKGEGVYLECKLAGADADPFKVILAQLVAIYTSLKNPSITQDHDVPQDHEEAVQAFAASTTLRDTLDRLSGSGLGTRLRTTLLKEAEIGSHDRTPHYALSV